MERKITVKGIGRMNVRPDRIVISLLLNAKDTEYGKAMRLAAEQLEELRGAILGAGFEKESLKTLDFNVNTVYEGEHDQFGNYKQRFAGYECIHSAKLKFDLDMELLGKTLSAITSCSANPELSIEFTVKDKAAVSEALLRAAAENATEKAELLCAASGVALGELLSIDYSWSDVSIVSPTNYRRGKAALLCAEDACVDISPEDISVSDTAVFIWEIR